jgi:beta-galactosidase/beta-glucuronidase
MRKILINAHSIIGLAFLCCFQLFSQVPALREQVSLNGIWNFTTESGEKTSITVPEFWDAAPGFTKKINRELTDENGNKIVREVTVPSTSIGIYEREILIPDDWKNKIIKIEFEGINHIAEVYLDDKLLTTHIGGWTPFTVDITNLVKSGITCKLKVVVKGGNHSPIVDANGYPQWPVGWFGQESRWGIIFDTWLRAYGPVYIEDAYIQASWRKKNIIISYDLVNQSGTNQEIQLQGEIRKNGNSKSELKLSGEKIMLHPGEKKTARIKSSWENPDLWNPETPNLYTITSRVVKLNTKDNKTVIIDEESRRFGFREIWIEGTKLMLNGHRLNLRGTSINTHGQGYNRGRYKYISPDTWNQTIDKLQSLNIQCVRFHQQPVSKRIIEIADERGLLVIEESPLYARDYILKSNNEVYFRNALTWLKPWIRDRRNNPSVIMWSSENEIGRDWLKWFSDKQLKTLADSIRAVDPSRPVIAEGDFDIGDDFYSDHYPEGVGRTVKGSIYSWDTLISKTKPSSFGEFLYGNTDGKEWWHGTWCRGLRYINAAQMMPYTLDWAWTADSISDVHNNLKNSYAPVALFDKDYDDLGIEVLRKKLYPELITGRTIVRNLILYNDCFTEESVQVEVRVESSGKLLANDIEKFRVPLGEHHEFKCEFIIPSTETGLLDMVLITRKNGKVTFRESRRFLLVKGENNIGPEKIFLKIN